MGDEALANKKYDDAIRFHMEAVSGSKGPDKTDRLLRLSEVAWKALEATPANQTAQKNTRYQLFRNALEEAKRQSPDAIEPRRRLAEFYFNAIRVLPAVDRPYVQFLEEADGILKIDPADHLTLFRRGIVYAMRSDVDAQTYGEKALADFRKAIELKKDSAEYWSQYLAYLQFLRTKDRAAAEDVIKAYEQAIQANPKNPDFYVGLGGFKYRMMPAEGASRETARKDVLGLFQKAIAAAPESATGYLAVAEVLINEGVACDRKGEKKQAAALYEKAMAVLVDARRKTGELHRVCHMQALVYERQGLFAKGIEAYREAIRELQGATDTRPGSPTPSPEMVKAMTGELYYRLGHALLNDAGRKEEKDRQPSIDEARQCLVAMRERTADEASVNLEARLLLGEKRLDEAYRVLQAAYDKNPSVLTFPNTLLLAELCVSKNIPTKAEAILKALVPPADTESTVQVLVLKAKCRSMLGDTAGASANVEEALRLDPGNKLAKALQTQLGTGQDRQKALAKWQAGQREEAIRDMERLVRRKNDDTQAIRDLAAMYDAAGRRTELLALLEDALKRLPDDRNIIFTRAVYSEADPARRKEAYLKSLHEIADPFERDVQLAQFYAMSEDFEQALVHLERAHGTKPNDKAVVGQLFIAELRRNNFDAARKWAMQLKALDAVAGQTALGDLAMTLRDPDTAIEAYSKVLATNKDAKEVFVNRGRCYARKRKYDLAEKDFQAAWDLDNRYLDAAVGLAQVAAMKKDQPALDKWVKTAIEMPGGIRVKWVRDQALASAEKRRESLQSLIQKREQIVAVDGDDEDNRLALGSLYMRSGETSKAEEQFTFVYGHSKNGAVLAAGRLAELYQNTRRPDKAKGILNDLQTKTDDRQGAMLTYADYLLRAEGPTPDCRKMIEAAIQLNEKDPRGYAEMARLHEAAERWDKAAALWEKVMVLGVRDIP
ncbi:MAG: tetratricopeptide repeat protein, partial [Planctomycetota bacterium]|nr:tetratricopeptide repeat protein [Planctomycetota bacterium]